METSQLICRANQLTGFYMMGTLGIKRLTLIFTIQLLSVPKETIKCDWTPDDITVRKLLRFLG